MALATAASVIGSVLVDALLVVIGEAVFPGTKGYVHFRFSDYTKLTVIGVIIACVAWPVVARLSSAPRWLYLRLAIVVTLLLWLPDLYILHQGQSATAVAVLVAMHLAMPWSPTTWSYMPPRYARAATPGQAGWRPGPQKTGAGAGAGPGEQSLAPRPEIMPTIIVRS
jgi:hypothetical protein